MLNNYDLLVALGIIDDDSPMPYRFETEDGRLESIQLELEPLEGIDFARALIRKRILYRFIYEQAGLVLATVSGR